MKWFHGHKSMLPNATQWGQIARGAVRVVAICQRDSGLWSYPTNDTEPTLAYAAPGTKEEDYRLKGAFGFESLTVTRNALAALTSLASYVPPNVLNNALAGIAACRNSEGAYGSRVLTFQGFGVNPSTRHAAMALLAQLNFVPQQQPPRRYEIFWPTVSWIIREQQSEGGWSFDFETRASEDPMSIASCLAALSCFLADPSAQSLPGNLSEEIGTRIRRAFERLNSLKTDLLWRPRYPGTQTSDNAFIIDMLDEGLNRGKLGVVVPRGSDEIGKVKEQLARLGLADGWPERFGGKEPGLAATISATCVLSDFVSRHCRREVLQCCDRFIIDRYFSKSGTATLTSWDWIMIGRLAAKRNGPLSEKDSVNIFAEIERVKTAERYGRLTQVLLRNVSKEARPAITHVLTFGGKRKIPYWHFQVFWQTLPPAITWSLSAIFGLFAGSVVYYFRSHIAKLIDIAISFVCSKF